MYKSLNLQLIIEIRYQKLKLKCDPHLDRDSLRESQNVMSTDVHCLCFLCSIVMKVQIKTSLLPHINCPTGKMSNLLGSVLFPIQHSDFHP